MSGGDVGLAIAAASLPLLELALLSPLCCALCSDGAASLSAGPDGRLLRSLIHCVRFLKDAWVCTCASRGGVAGEAVMYMRGVACCVCAKTSRTVAVKRTLLLTILECKSATVGVLVQALANTPGCCAAHPEQPALLPHIPDDSILQEQPWLVLPPLQPRAQVDL